jgi:UDP-2,3-diacylglucosamine hydrolase
MIKTTNIAVPEGKKVYFSSDNHLGAPNNQASKLREEIFIKWLNEIKEDAAAIFLLGDLFDFWFEYKKVVPKGFIRVLGKLADLSDAGIPIYFFVGNHDLWMNGYFEEELNIPVFTEPQHFTINKKTFLIGHGDGLGPGDKGYKRMKKVFTNPLFNWLFRWLHPDIGVRIAQYLSVKNKLISGKEDITYLGEDNEWLIQYCKQRENETHHNYYIFGHRHLPLEIQIAKDSQYLNLGDWITYYTYGEFDGENMCLLSFKR